MVPQATLLALIAGYADTIGYLRFDAFAGLMTGNTILLGVALWGPDPLSALFHGGIIVIFLIGVIVSRILLRIGCSAWVPLTISSILLVVCSSIDLTDLLAYEQRIIAASLLALAMGVQNSAATRFGNISLNTVFITGNIQKLGEGLIDWLFPPKGHGGERTIAIFALVWLGYAIGAVGGAAASSLGPRALLIPAALLPFVFIREVKDTP